MGRRPQSGPLPTQLRHLADAEAGDALVVGVLRLGQVGSGPDALPLLARLAEQTLAHARCRQPLFDQRADGRRYLHHLRGRALRSGYRRVGLRFVPARVQLARRRR